MHCAWQRERERVQYFINTVLCLIKVKINTIELIVHNSCCCVFYVLHLSKMEREMEIKIGKVVGVNDHLMIFGP